MASFKIDGVDYESKIMDGETWPLVLKRLLPVITAVVGVADELKVQFPGVGDGVDDATAEADPGEDETDEIESPNARMARVAMPVALRLASMRDIDVKFVLDAALDVTSRRIGPNAPWMPVRQRGVIQNQNDGRYMTKFAITWYVLTENAADMFSRLGLDMSAFTAMIPPGFNG